MKDKKMQSQQCLDDKTDADMLSQTMKGGHKETKCKQTSFKRIANGWEFESVCEMTDHKLISHARITGDFKSQFLMEVRSRREPALKNIADTDATIRGKFLGPCPANMKPGDTKINGMLVARIGMPANMSKEQIVTNEKNDGTSKKLA